MVMVDTGADYDCVKKAASDSLRSDNNLRWVRDLPLEDCQAGSAFVGGPKRVPTGLGEWNLALYGSYTFGGKKQLHSSCPASPHRVQIILSPASKRDKDAGLKLGLGSLGSTAGLSSPCPGCLLEGGDRIFPTIGLANPAASPVPAQLPSSKSRYAGHGALGTRLPLSMLDRR